MGVGMMWSTGKYQNKKNMEWGQGKIFENLDLAIPGDNLSRLYNNWSLQL